MPPTRPSRAAGTVPPFASSFRRALDDLRERDPALARLLEAGSDVLLMLDGEGVIRDVSFADETLAREVGTAWVGRPMHDTVTRESRSKVDTMLGLPEAGALRQEINHALPGRDLPIRYAVVRLPGGVVAAAGRDLRDIARLQQQIVESSLAAERDFAVHRATEIRSRALFQSAPEAIVVADLASRRIVDANTAAEGLLRRLARQLTGLDVQALFSEADAEAVQDGFVTARALGRAEWPPLALRSGGREVAVAASLVRAGADPQLLLRLTPTDAPARATPAGDLGGAWAALRRLPEPLVVTRADLTVVDGNEAFLDLVGAATPEQVRGVPLSRYVGRHEGDLARLVARLSETPAIRRVPTVARGPAAASEGVELSAGTAGRDEQVFAFLLRAGRPDPSVAGDGGRPLKPAGEMTELVGRMPLRDIVRETTDVIEEMCIEMALELTGDNRASAAEMLGLSRQSLYSKLRRFGIGDLPDGGDGDRLS